MNPRSLLSPVGVSNLYTMGCTGKTDPRQIIPPRQTELTPEQRLLRAKLLFEEALETLEALGTLVHFDGAGNWEIKIKGPMDFKESIDGCCDLIYVAVGTMLQMGVPDIPPMLEVCRANSAKFPNGEATVNEYGKFTKPEGWTPPNHEGVLASIKDVDLTTIQKGIMKMEKAHQNFVSNTSPSTFSSNTAPNTRPPVVTADYHDDNNGGPQNHFYKGPGWYGVRQAYDETGKPLDKSYSGPYPMKHQAINVAEKSR